VGAAEEPQNIYERKDVACIAVRYEEGAMLESFHAAEAKEAASL
jgi:hypothetical protein